MPKAILHFNLPGEETYFRDAKNGSLLADLIMGILSDIRNRLKYEDLSEEVRKPLEELQGFIYEELAEQGIILD